MELAIRKNLLWLELLDDRAERDGREEREPSDDEDDADRTSPTNMPLSVLNVPADSATMPFAASDSAECQGRDHDPEAAESLSSCDDVVERGVPAQPCEGRAVVVRLRGEGVEDLCEPVRPVVERACSSGRIDTAMAVKMRTIMGMTSTSKAESFTSLDWIFLPRYSGVRPTISPPMNTAMMARGQDRVHPRSRAAR